MRHATSLRTITIAIALAASPVHAQYAQLIGAYKVEEGQPCRTSVFQGNTQEDPHFGAACVPWAAIGSFDPFTIQMAIAELTDPALMQQLMLQNMLGNTPLSEAYEVEVDKRDGSTYDLTDGTVLRALDSTYVGYIGYHEEAILYRDTGDWHFCVAGSEFKVEILRDGQSSYNRRRIAGTRSEITMMDPCR